MLVLRMSVVFLSTLLALALRTASATLYDREWNEFFLKKWESARTARQEAIQETGTSSRSYQRRTKGDDCEEITVLLTYNDTDAGLISEFEAFEEVTFGSKQGGQILISSPDNSTEKIGVYTSFTTFLGPVDFETGEVACYGQGAYQFGPGEQIAFVSPCSGLPFFTIVGGQGVFEGAYGTVEFMIVDEDGEGWLHRINVCVPGQ